MTINPVLTIGHSNHSWELFAQLLTQHFAGALVDVRSVPYSRYNPHFNRNLLGPSLDALGIDYVYLGRELGGRPNDSTCYANGHVCYDRLAKTTAFRRGLDRLTTEAATHRIVLMCAEKDPLDCHRTLLVARALEAEGVNVLHVLADGSVETHVEAMDRLLAQHHLSLGGDLFTPRDEFISIAVERQSQRVGFVDDMGERTGD